MSLRLFPIKAVTYHTMYSIDELATQDKLTNSFLHKQALKLNNYIGMETDYNQTLHYWLASCLDSNYEGDIAPFFISPYDKTLTKEQNKLRRENEIHHCMELVLSTLWSCSGNLLNPTEPDQIPINNGLYFGNARLLGEGSYGKVYLVKGQAVKVATYTNFGPELISLIKETTALAMLGRLRFIGTNNNQYYIGMDYLPQEINNETPGVTMKQLVNELSTIHSLGIIHCDIKLANMRLDENGKARLIDFGSCCFQPTVNGFAEIGTDIYRDYNLLNKEKASYSFEVDIWSLGIVFYILNHNEGPWDTTLINESSYKETILKQWLEVIPNTTLLIRKMLSINKEDRWNTKQLVLFCKD